jgi:hypothetical protein
MWNALRNAISHFFEDGGGTFGPQPICEPLSVLPNQKFVTVCQ